MGQLKGETALERLVDLLDLEVIEVDIFRGKRADEALQRVFGGQVAGQALVAAGRTVPTERPVHSLHAYFLRPGDPAVPIVYEVDRIRDGRSFTTRRVVAIQHGRAIFHLSASFQEVEVGLEHAVAMPEVPGPEGLETLSTRMQPYAGEMDGWWVRPRPIDVRYVGDPPRVAQDKGDRNSSSQVWMRADGELPDDPLLHVCAVAYASDMTLLDSTLMAHGRAWGTGDIIGASLDHAMWFHRPFRADRWWLYDQASPWTGGGRGLAHGSIYTRDGALAVSVVQEGVLRVPRA
ncbi:MAG TPA: acyl-CoA thioesterase II [Mycobacteriales bacterium]|jgi:acyl-CoA thioesterase-2|nr:acyl-CoA thioesterase II [Mycobacteriales bacterium]